MNPRIRPGVLVAAGLLLCMASYAGAQAEGFRSGDLYQLRSVSDEHVSPDGTRIANSIVHNDRPGQPYSHVRILEWQPAGWPPGSDELESALRSCRQHLDPKPRTPTGIRW